MLESDTTLTASRTVFNPRSAGLKNYACPKVLPPEAPNPPTRKPLASCTQHGHPCIPEPRTHDL